MINEINNIAWYKLNGLLRSYIVHGGYFGLADIFIVNEYPKSGGTWLSQMLSEALEIPFPRNRLPVLGSSLMHGHFQKKWNMRNVVLLWRDGRDVIVSQYHHIIHMAGTTGHKGRMNKRLGFSNPDDIEKNLPRFIEFMFDPANHKKMTWPEYVDYWHGYERAVHTKYELLKQNAQSELERILRELTGKTFESDKIDRIIQKYSFMKQTGRNPGEQVKSSFLRKGIVGDWKNTFNEESREVFNAMAGQQLIKLGYEADAEWVHED